MENEEKTSVAHIRINKNSWWVSKDGNRVLVITALVYGGEKNAWPIEPTYYEVFEKGKVSPYTVPAKDLKAGILSGHLMEILNGSVSEILKLVTNG